MVTNYWEDKPPKVYSMGSKVPKILLIEDFRLTTFGTNYYQPQVVQDLGVSGNSGTPQKSIFIGFSIINHPFWGPQTTNAEKSRATNSVSSIFWDVFVSSEPQQNKKGPKTSH